jgi:hypothetical protein
MTLEPTLLSITLFLFLRLFEFTAQAVAVTGCAWFLLRRYRRDQVRRK